MASKITTLPFDHQIHAFTDMSKSRRFIALGYVRADDKTSDKKIQLKLICKPKFELKLVSR